MIKTYYMDIRKLNQPEIFEGHLANLSNARKEKVLRMKNQKAKMQSLGAGILLDYGLKQYGIREKDAVIIQRKNGKPYLAADMDIYFNLSHSGDYVAAAFGTCEVGIDIEYFHKDGMKIANRFFTPAERMHLESYNNKKEQDELFLRYWTLKESFLKITGEGMRLPLDAFELKLDEAVTVTWNKANPPHIHSAEKWDDQTYYFKEIELDSENNEEKYRIAVCALEAEFAPEIIRVECDHEI